MNTFDYKKYLAENKLNLEELNTKYKPFVNQVYKHVNALDSLLGANKPPAIPVDNWGKIYGAVGDVANEADFLMLIKSDEEEDDNEIFDRRQMENLNEGKKKKTPSYMAELSEIDKQSAITAMEAKINKLAEMAEAKTQRLNMVSEDENLSELIDKKAMNEMRRNIKEIEKAKLKLEKLYEKACGSKPKEMVDEDASKDSEDSDLDDAAVGAMGEGYSTPSYEEDDTDPMNEEFNRFRKLAGL
tara:strand:+ start:3052 stop:3780 length:729 start_codon:yes stop_codon:yes gene_type:complete